MKRLLCLVLLIAGCGTNLGEPPATRDRITPAIEAACEIYGPTLTTTFIAMFESDYETGRWEEQEYMLMVEPECEESCNERHALDEEINLTCYISCNTCFIAIIDEIWP